VAKLHIIQIFECTQPRIWRPPKRFDDGLLLGTTWFRDRGLLFKINPVLDSFLSELK